MPNSVRCIIKKCLHKGAINQQEFDKIMRKLDEPIRCKNCKHYDKFIATLTKFGHAVWDEYCWKLRGSVTADDFCSWAERREEE